MLKQIIFIAFIATSITSSCATTEDKMCKSCVTGICAVCEHGYNDILGGGVCKTPSTSISNCHNYSNATTCQACELGYYLKANACVAIVTENCATANPLNGDCLSCKSGKVYDTATKKCTDTACSAANCGLCSVVGTVQTCSMCNSGYALTVGTSGVTCESNSGNCAMTSTLVCTMCEEGYYMMGSTCKEGSSASVQRLGFMVFFAFLLL